MNSIPLFVNVTPVPAVNINGFVTVIAISDTVVPGEETESDRPSVNCPLLPVVLFIIASVSVLNTSFFGVINFCVVER